MGGLNWIHLVVVMMVWFIPLIGAVAAFLFLASIARDLRQIRRLLQERSGRPL